MLKLTGCLLLALITTLNAVLLAVLGLLLLLG
jgi:hypothetical protein